MTTNYNWIIKLLPPLRAFYLALKRGDMLAAAKAAATIFVYAAVFSGLVVITAGCAELSLKTTTPPITLQLPAENTSGDITVTPN